MTREELLQRYDFTTKEAEKKKFEVEKVLRELEVLCRELLDLEEKLKENEVKDISV
jgi:hypothetical protein